ncbi:hypothetical protein CDL15_Pgr025989 [Punica granatum]|uniref:Uncharacterized protein n=1 Tax=Punica granatum TaxID=22663 RepID=A0A218WCA4_PUNGR|nr:hypothetical protein CDL15_Pgr025989 [Punica granatum]
MALEMPLANLINAVANENYPVDSWRIFILVDCNSCPAVAPLSFLPYQRKHHLL